MALKIVKGSIDRMFDKNLQDLVRGIRNHKEDEVRRGKNDQKSIICSLSTSDIFSITVINGLKSVSVHTQLTLASAQSFYPLATH